MWREANLTGSQLSRAVDSVWKILNHLHVKNGGTELEWPSYDEAAVERIAKKLMIKGVS